MAAKGEDSGVVAWMKQEVTAVLLDVAVAHRRLSLGKELLGGESTDSSACQTGADPTGGRRLKPLSLIVSMVGF